MRFDFVAEDGCEGSGGVALNPPPSAPLNDPAVEVGTTPLVASDNAFGKSVRR